MNKDKIIALQNSGKLFYIAATGGGTSFIGEFLKIPGGSKCIVGGHIPYAVEATNAFIGGKLDKYSDGNAARRLAVASYEYCTKLNFPTDKCVGIGVACSLVKRDERYDRKHVSNVAIHTDEFTLSVEIEFKKIPPDDYEHIREFEETATNIFTLDVLNYLFVENANKPINKNQLITVINDQFDELIGAFFTITGTIEFNRLRNTDLYCDSIEYIKKNDTLVIYPGSYNPLHDAHREIYNLAHKITQLPVFYELSVTNSYKPSMDYVDLENRYKQFNTVNWLNAVILTKAPRFVDKVNLLKKHFNPKEIIIVVGADTWERVYDAAAHKNGDIKFFEDNNVKFLVFGRNAEIKNQDSVLFIKNDLALNYNNNISSTAIRKVQASA